MKPLSLIAMFIAAVLLILGFAGRSGSGRILSNAVIVAASFIIGVVAFVWIIAFLKKDKK